MICPVKGPPLNPICRAPLGHSGPHDFVSALSDLAYPALVASIIPPPDVAIGSALAYLNAWIRDAATGDQDVAARLAWYILRKRLEELELNAATHPNP